MFENDFMESLSHVHPATPAIVWTPVIAWLIWRAFVVHELAASTVAGLALLGLFVWTLSEYLLHRLVFHFQAKSAIGKRIHFMIHGVHHDAPDDATRLVMPPVAAFILAAVLYTIFRLPLGPVLVEPFFAFFLIGYLAYDYIHYYVHHFNPRTRIGKFIKQNHMMHHFVTHNARWGVSSPLWDYVFGTAEEPGREPKKAAAQ
jgi:sterol desaturase/sphingolipid hydroxylase (fatty acid hydroxylase superfamily)